MIEIIIKNIKFLDPYSPILYIVTLITPIVISITIGLSAQGSFAIIKNDVNFISTILLFGLPQSLLLISSVSKINRSYIKLIAIHIIISTTLAIFYFYFFNYYLWELLSLSIFSQLIILILRGMLIPHINIKEYATISYGNIPIFLFITLILYYCSYATEIYLSYTLSLILIALYSLSKFKNIKNITKNQTEKIKIYQIYLNSFFFILRDAAALLTLKLIYDKLSKMEGITSVGKLSILFVFCSIANVFISIYGPSLVAKLIRKDITALTYFKSTYLISLLVIICIFIIFSTNLKFFLPENIYTSFPDKFSLQVITIIFFLTESTKIIVINYFNAIYGPVIPALSEILPLLYIIYLYTFTIEINSEKIIYILFFYSIFCCFILLIGYFYLSLNKNKLKNIF